MDNSIFPKFVATKTDCIAGRSDGVYVEEYSPVGGKTLRDYFAANVLQGMCAHRDTWGIATNEKIAISSYELADAMLAERAK